METHWDGLAINVGGRAITITKHWASEWDKHTCIRLSAMIIDGALFLFGLYTHGQACMLH